MSRSAALRKAETQIAETMGGQIEAFRNDVVAGLSNAPQKTLPSRWLYDDCGSELFEQITGLPEYYPTRTETAILTANAESLASFCGPRAVLLEYGAGASVKSEIVLKALVHPRMYVPIDIAGDFLAVSAERLRRSFPGLDILPVAADFTQPFELPDGVPAGFHRTGMFLGSTIGNLGPAQAIAFLRQLNRHVRQSGIDGPQSGRTLVGIDLVKSTDILIPAYDDAAGVTARFNLNLLTRINRELDGTFRLENFRHEARWNPRESAIEMHLVCTADHHATVAGRTFAFTAGETIHTESSRKYTPDRFNIMAREAGWSVTQIWTDEDDLFAMVGLDLA